jgi:hypothetical protein
LIAPSSDDAAKSDVACGRCRPGAARQGGSDGNNSARTGVSCLSYLGEGDGARLVDELAKLLVDDQGAIGREIADADLMRRCFFGTMLARAHAGQAARDKDHVGRVFPTQQASQDTPRQEFSSRLAQIKSCSMHKRYVSAITTARLDSRKTALTGCRRNNLLSENKRKFSR